MLRIKGGGETDRHDTGPTQWDRGSGLWRWVLSTVHVGRKKWACTYRIANFSVGGRTAIGKDFLTRHFRVSTLVLQRQLV